MPRGVGNGVSSFFKLISKKLSDLFTSKKLRSQYERIDDVASSNFPPGTIYYPNGDLSLKEKVAIGGGLFGGSTALGAVNIVPFLPRDSDSKPVVGGVVKDPPYDPSGGSVGDVVPTVYNPYGNEGAGNRSKDLDLDDYDAVGFTDFSGLGPVFPRRRRKRRRRKKN